MNTRTIIIPLVFIASLVTIAGAWYFIALPSVAPQQTIGSSRDTTDIRTRNSTGTGSENKFATLEGDTFDEAFIADMLAHHEGALSMSEQAQSSTTREEIRVLAGNIIQSQSIEFAKMKAWQQEWRFEATTTGGHMSHGGGAASMTEDMMAMQNKLQNLQGEAYNKEFLTQMIIHHQQAVDMARYAETNAKRQEIKDLAREIIVAQEQEIAQMKAWQISWGY